MQGLMVPRVGASEQGQLQGALQGLRGLCALATPLLYTQVFSRGGAVIPGAPYWLAAVLVGAALLLALRAAEPVPVPAVQPPERR
jgi:DHA1 family tetracycline resistance protein-like MFS transporter